MAAAADDIIRPLRPAPCPAALARTQLGTCTRALEDRCVTFHDVATAWFAISNPDLPADLRERFAAIYPELRQTFAEPRGGIVTSISCCHLRAAAALTSSDRAAKNPEGVIRFDGTLLTAGAEEPTPMPASWLRARRLLQQEDASSSAIHVELAHGDPADLKAKELLFKCLKLHNRATEFLQPKPRKISMRTIFGVIAALLSALDSRQAATGVAQLTDAEARCLEGELERAESYIDRSIQRTAQLEYFAGMLWSGIVLLILFAAAGAFAVIAPDVPVMKHQLVLAALAGAFGAVVSVLQRMASGRLRLAAEDGPRTIRILGTIRPVLGAILGVLLVVLLTGDLTPFSRKGVEVNALPFYIVGLAFIAGFSERFAQDMLSGAAAPPR
jgi:hypothetical protein